MTEQVPEQVGTHYARALLEALAREADACLRCGKPHVVREVHPGKPHDRSHTGGCASWADPEDGHPYVRRFPAGVGEWLRQKGEEVSDA